MEKRVAGGRFDHVARGCLNTANDLFDSGERAEPMCCVRQLRAGNTGKEIFRAAGKAREARLIPHREASARSRARCSAGMATPRPHRVTMVKPCGASFLRNL